MGALLLMITCACCRIAANQTGPTDANFRMEQLLNASEDIRHVEYEWRTYWLTDQQSDLTPVHIHGGLGQ